MRCKRLLFFLPIFISACATEQKYRDKIATWINSPRESLVETWGEPEKITNLEGGRQIYYYQTRHFQEVPVGTDKIVKTQRDPKFISIPIKNGTDSVVLPIAWQRGEREEFQPAPAQSLSYQCSTFFEINPSGLVSRSGSYGNNCKSH